MKRSEFEKMIAGDLYRGDDSNRQHAHRAKALVRLYNQTTETQRQERQQLLANLLGQIKAGLYIEPPFYIDYGLNTSIGENVYINTGAVFLDTAPIKIGNNVLFGPRVGLYTPAHPIDAAVRNEGLEYGKPITIGNDAWIGGNVVVNPGVTIGSNVVIGSGSIVTKDIPDDVIAVGNPCHVLRKITAEDKAYWQTRRSAYFAEIEANDD